jgi:DNA-binding MarR family transcriptional regulator
MSIVNPCTICGHTEIAAIPALGIEHDAAVLINDVARLLNRRYDQRMATLGLTRAQWWVLARLYFHDGLTQTELAEELGFGKAAVGALVDRLEAKGWVERRADPADRRAWRVHRSERAQMLLAKMKRIAQATSAEALGGLGAGERASLVRLLERLQASLLEDATTRGQRRPARPRKAGRAR